MKRSVHTLEHSRWIHRCKVWCNGRSHESGLVQLYFTMPAWQAIHTSQTKWYKRTAEAPKTCTDDGTQEKGASVFDFYNISYNAGYTKYRGAKKPSFPDFGPFRRFLSLLGWLSRFFGFCTVVLFECIALYVWSAFCFTIVQLLSVKTFLTIAITFWFRPLIFFKSVQSAWFHQYIPAEASDFSRKVSEPLECP